MQLRAADRLLREAVREWTLRRPAAAAAHLARAAALPRHRRNAPTIGQDTDAVLGEMGLSPSQIQALKDKGIVA